MIRIGAWAGGSNPSLLGDYLAPMHTWNTALHIRSLSWKLILEARLAFNAAHFQSMQHLHRTHTPSSQGGSSLSL